MTTITKLLGTDALGNTRYAGSGDLLQLSASGVFESKLIANKGVIFPSSDPGIAGAWWDSAGTLTKSSG